MVRRVGCETNCVTMVVDELVVGRFVVRRVGFGRVGGGMSSCGTS